MSTSSQNEDVGVRKEDARLELKKPLRERESMGDMVTVRDTG
jgi:hypothetical protein